MKLGVVCIARNEADILASFLQHVGALFDHAVLMDHGSIDGTLGMLRAAAARPGWECWRVDVPGNHHAEFVGLATRHLLRTTDVEHVALLDVDEFLDVPHRAALEAELAPLAANPRVVPHLAWRNCIPVRPGHRFDLASRLWAAPAPSPHGKVMLPRRLFEATGGQARSVFGNHDIDPGDGGRLDYHRIGQLLHVPIRSLAQLKMKVLCGTLVRLGRDGEKATNVAHWSDMLDRMTRGELDQADLVGIAARYGEIGAASEPLPPRRLRHHGFTRRRLAEVAHVRQRVATPRSTDPLDLIAATIRDWSPAPATAPALRLVGDVVQVDLPSEPPVPLTA